jgi:hypothetical protein
MNGEKEDLIEAFDVSSGATRVDLRIELRCFVSSKLVPSKDVKLERHPLALV